MSPRSALIRGLCLLFLFFATLAAYAAAPPAKGAKWSVRWQPAKVVNGSPVVFRVSSSNPLQSLSGKWLDHEVFFSPDAKAGVWYAIAGASLDVKPGSYPLTLAGKTQGGSDVSFDKSVPVGKGKYRRVAITVSKEFVQPSPEQLQRIKEESALKQQVFAKVGPDREWSGDFQPPVNAQISGVFGTARTVNGEEQSVHRGLDFGVPSGTPVDAVNRGTVLLARPMFYEGGFVVVDHGQGLFTLYMHLSKIEVKEGDEVTRGQELALSGGTGKVTGPHLHLAVRWQGIYLDPAILLKLNLP